MSLEVQHVPLVVLVGAFNSQILRDPQWVKKFLFPGSAQKEIPLNYNVAMVTGELSSNMTIDGTEFRVEPERLKITPPSLTQADFVVVEEVISRLAAELPHTPLSAFGVNFQYREGRSRCALRSNALLSGILGDCDNMGQLKLESRVKYEGGILTFSITEGVATEGVALVYDFNFHFPIESVQGAAMAALKDSILDGLIGKCETHAQEMAAAASRAINSLGGQ